MKKKNGKITIKSNPPAARVIKKKKAPLACAFVSRSRRAIRAAAIQGRRDHGARSFVVRAAVGTLRACDPPVNRACTGSSTRKRRTQNNRLANNRGRLPRDTIVGDACAVPDCAAAATHSTAVAERAVSGGGLPGYVAVGGVGGRAVGLLGKGETEEKSIVYGRCRRARVRAGRRRALAAIPEAGQFVSSARFVMPAVVLPDRHCFAATTSTKSLSAAAVPIAVTAAGTADTAANNTGATTTTLFWLPVVDSPACCYCCYCGGRLFVVGGGAATATGNNGSIASRGSVVGRFDACSPFSTSRYFGRPCRCGDGTAVVLLVPYVLGPPCFRPIILPPAFVTAAATNHLRHHRRIQHHQLYNAAVKNMETR